jgi:hypothetical protein
MDEGKYASSPCTNLKTIFFGTSYQAQESKTLTGCKLYLAEKFFDSDYGKRFPYDVSQSWNWRWGYLHDIRNKKAIDKKLKVFAGECLWGNSNSQANGSPLNILIHTNRTRTAVH